MKRRTLLLSGLGAAGALIVGVCAAPPRSRLGQPQTLPVVDGQVGLNAWIKIAADGSVLLASPRSEMGQGAHTGLAQLVAEELDLPLARVQIIEAGHDTLYGNVAASVGNLPFGPREMGPRDEGRLNVRLAAWFGAKLGRELGLNVTGGSTSLPDAWEPLRLAAATARAQLLAAAAEQHGLTPEGLSIQAGHIRHGTQDLGHFGPYAASAAGRRVGTVSLKPRNEWRVIGQAAPRVDLAGKVNGSARFGMDVRLPGQLYAAIQHCPWFGGGLGTAQVDAVRALPGVVRVVALPPMAGSQPAYAVVARSTWHAQQAARALQVAWPPPVGGGVDSDAIARDLLRQAQEAHASGGGFAFAEAGDAAATIARSARRVEAVYTAPYLAHAPLEPMNCTAQVRDGQVTLWLPTQAPSHARAAAARAVGVAPEAVTVHVTYLGGGFGRRLDVDYAAQAARVALECSGAPVQLVWSREEDMTHDFYRPAAAAVMQAGLDAQGRPTALAVTHAGDALYARWLERIEPERTGRIELLNRTAFLDTRLPAALRQPQDAPDKAAAEGIFTQPYAFDALRLAHVATKSGVPIGPWRAVGHSHHAFFIESFIDELAHAAGADPVAFRLSLLDGLPRHAAVLRRAAEAAGWGQALPPGRTRGVALHESVGSIVAQVAEVEKAEGGLRVRRVVCAIDCGTVINPGQVARQMESAVIFGLSAALFGRIDIRAGRVQQQNFPDYPMLTLADTPVIDTFFVDSEAPPGGVGEAGLPPIAPAVGNAWFALTGERKRSLPL